MNWFTCNELIPGHVISVGHGTIQRHIFCNFSKVSDKCNWSNPGPDYNGLVGCSGNVLFFII